MFAFLIAAAVLAGSGFAIGLDALNHDLPAPMTPTWYVPRVNPPPPGASPPPKPESEPAKPPQASSWNQLPRSQNSADMSREGVVSCRIACSA